MCTGGRGRRTISATCMHVLPLLQRFLFAPRQDKTRQDMQAFSTLMTSLARANANAYVNANANAARVMSRPFVVAGIGAEHQ